jgi:hypothetical protein
MASLWQGKFFLQTGLPGSLPRAPTVIQDPDYPKMSLLEKRARQKEKGIKSGCRGKDRAMRRTRNPILFNFFESIHGVEAKAGEEHAVAAADLRARFAALTKPERAYWEFMHDLFLLYREQQWSVRVTEFRAYTHAKMRRILAADFYRLEEPQQLQLVRDHLAVRWAKENEDFAKKVAEQHDRNLLHDVRKDVANILLRIDAAFRCEAAAAAGPDPVPDDSESETEAES